MSREGGNRGSQAAVFDGLPGYGDWYPLAWTGYFGHDDQPFTA